MKFSRVALSSITTGRGSARSRGLPPEKEGNAKNSKEDYDCRRDPNHQATGLVVALLNLPEDLVVMPHR